MRGAGTLSLTEALRDRAWRTARAEAYRFQVAMALLGFVGGTILVVPAVLWLTPARQPSSGAVSRPVPAVVAQAASGNVASAPVPVPPPWTTEHELPAAPAPVEAPPPIVARANPLPSPEQRRAIEAARGLIRSGQLQAAREALTRPGLADIGEVAFMLAETYDPNVLAALGVTVVRAEADTARRYYEAALARGITAAAHRLEGLD